jgi:hypothetical protein
MKCKITDDTGIIALIDPDAYGTFVSEDWEYEQLLEHFSSQMDRGTLLIWSTEMENIWDVEIFQSRPILDGFRYAKGFIKSTKGRLLPVSYDDLTYVAQYVDAQLPLSHGELRIITVPAGGYHATIIQVSDHSGLMSDLKKPDYKIFLQSTNESEPKWSEILWD